LLDIPLIIAGEEIRTGDVAKVTMPHQRKHVLATYHKAGEKEIRIMGYIERAGKSKKAQILFGGKGDDSEGYFIAPTVIFISTTSPLVRWLVNNLSAAQGPPAPMIKPGPC
jgi:hypothetical protein